MTVLKVLKHPLYLVLALLLIAGTSVLSAQEQPTGDGQPEVPNTAEGQALIDEMERRREEYNAAFQAYLETVKLEDFSIVYFSSPNVLQMDFINDASIESAFKAQIITDGVVPNQFGLQTYPDVVFVHGAAASEIDTTWTQAAYRNGVIFIGLSMPFEDMQRVTGDYCLKDPNPGYLKYNPEMFLYFDYRLEVEKEEYRSELDRGFLETCKTPQKPDTGWITGEHGTYNSFILSDEWIPWMRDFIRSEVAQQTYVSILSPLPFPIDIK